jgi:hypothetical protein
MSLTKARNRMIANAVIDVTDFGADPTGLIDSTAAINNALSAGTNIFFPNGTYLTTGSHELSSFHSIHGEGESKIKPTGAPTAVFTISDTDVSARDSITINNLSIDGSCTYFIYITGGNSRFHNFTNLTLSNGAGTALIYCHVTSATKAPARWEINNIDARKSGFVSVFKMTRDATALAAGITADNFFIRRINSWANNIVIDIQFPVASFVIRYCYGGLFGGNVNTQRVIKISDDTGGVSQSDDCQIENIHMEAWDQGCIAVDVTSANHMNIVNIKSIRINLTKSSLRAVKLSKVIDSFINLVHQFDSGGTPIAGYYPTLELDSDCSNNTIMILGTSFVNNVLDNGYRNIYPGVRNLRYLYSSTARVTKTGIISSQQNIKTFTIPANQFGAYDGIKIFAAGDTTGVGTKRFQIILDDGTTEDPVAQFWDVPAAAWRAEIDIWNAGDLTNQRTSILTFWNGAIVQQTTSNETTNFANDVEVRIDVISISGAGEIINTDAFYIEPIYNIT